MHKNQSGNVLVYILIAVALLAALSYTVAQSSRGSVGKLTAEKSGLYATEIIEYGNILSQAVSQIRLRGFKDSEISFENDVVTGYTNANCTDSECEIFNINGGGVQYSTPKGNWLDSSNSAETRYGELYFNGSSSVMEIGTDGDDLILSIPYINKDLCVEINRKLGIIPATDALPSETNGPFDIDDKFTGSYGGALDQKISGNATTGESTILHGEMSGCTESSGAAPNPAVNTYHYYQVLVAR